MNRLQVLRAEFIDVMKVFRPRHGGKPKTEPALMAFFDGYLSIESKGAVAVMHAEGDWQGRATFSGTVLHALVMAPPTQDPLVISYAEGHLLIAGMTIPCEWSNSGPALFDEVANPDLLDLLAIALSLPRAEARSPVWRAKTGPALKERDRLIRLAARHLEKLGVSEIDIRALVDEQVQLRMKPARVTGSAKR